MLERRIYPAMSYGSRGVFEGLDLVRRYLDRLSEGVFGEQSLSRSLSSGVFPAINLTQDTDNFYVRAELPGMNADQLGIEVVGRNLTIAGERKIGQDENVRYHRREREAGSFSRIIDLPGDFDAEKVEAAMVNGILTVTLPKAGAAKPRQISVR